MTSSAVAADAAPLRERISAELTAATKARADVRLSTLRLIQCAVRDRDIAARASDRTSGCDETKTYDEAGRPELAEREREEIAVIREFMPEPLTAGELAAAVREVVDELGATGLKDMGRCMETLKARYAGRFTVSEAAAAVKALLS